MTDGIAVLLQELGQAFQQGWDRADRWAEGRRLWNAVRIRSAGWDRELDDLKGRYEALRKRHEASPFADPDVAEKLAIACVREALAHWGDALPPDPIIDALGGATLALINDEVFFGFPHIDWEVPLSLDEGMALKGYLDRKEHFLTRPLQRIELWSRTLAAIWSGMLDLLPEAALAPAGPQQQLLTLSASSIDLMRSPAEAIERLIATCFDDTIARSELFTSTRERLEANVCAASGIPAEERAASKRPLLLPTASTLSGAPLAESYLSGTEFAAFFATELPLALPQQVRFEHCHILGGTGHGKTQLLQLLIRQDLDQVVAGEASVVVIDSQGDLIRTISRLDLFDPAMAGSLAERLVIIDPNDITYPTALNLFDADRPRLAHYGQAEREKLLNATIELYEYMFGELLGAELTQKQGVIFRYLARLMLAIPDATVQTLRELMEDGTRFRSYMQQLQGTARHFFEAEFFHPSFRATKQQILKRLWGVLSNPTFERMFSYPRNKVDLFTLMNGGSVILISTAKELLKQEGSSIFGRFFIAQIVQAATERAIIPRSERKPTFVYIDEAADYLDHNVEQLVNQARKYGMGLTIAHQNLDQLSPAVRASIMASTSIKLAGGISAKDARTLSADMGCEPDMLQAMRKRRDRTEFAAWIKNLTPQAVRATVPLGAVDALPALDNNSYIDLLARNRDRYCVLASEVDSHIERIRQVAASARPASRSAALAEPSEPEETVLRQEQELPVDRPAVIALPDEQAPIAPSQRPRPTQPVMTPPLGQGGREHIYIQKLIKEAAQQNGWRAIIEQPMRDAEGRCDVGLQKDQVRIACEISISTSGEHEMGNVAKCLADGFDRVFLITPSERRLAALKKGAAGHFPAAMLERMEFFLPEQLVAHLNSPEARPVQAETVSRGYKVKVSQASPDLKQGKQRRDTITGVIAQSLKRMKSKKPD